MRVTEKDSVTINMLKYELIESEQLQKLNIEGQLPVKAYCYHCTKDNTYFLKKEQHNEFINGKKIEFYTYTPYCNMCGNECYIYNIDKYNKKVAQNIYNKKNNSTTDTEIII